MPEAAAETKHLLSGALTRTRDEQCAAERQAQRRRINHLSSPFRRLNYLGAECPGCRATLIPAGHSRP